MNSTTAREMELMTQSGNSAIGEKEEMLQGQVLLHVGSEIKTFNLPKPLDDGGIDVSLKARHLGLRSSLEREVTAVYREMELMTQSWNSAMEEKEGLLEGLVPPHVESEIKTFCLPQPLDDNGTDITLKEWQLGLRSSVEREATTVYPFKPSKGRTRARFTPVQPWLDEFIISPSDKLDSAPRTPWTPRTPASGTRINCVSPRRLESCRGDLLQQELGLSNEHGHNVDEVSGIASPGVAFNEESSNDAKLDNCDDARVDRVSSLRISFLNDLEVSRSPSPPKVGYRSLSMPKTRVEPIVHAVRPREGKDSPLPLPEIETAYQSRGMSASRDRESQLRHSSRQAGSFLDSICERTKYDSASDFLSSSSASSFQSQRENTSNSYPNSPPSLLRCNGRRQYDEEEKEDDEDVKAGILCGGGLPDTNISADFVRLVSKLCRLTVPLPEQSASRSLQKRGRNRSNSLPALISWDSMQINSSMPCEDYAVIGRQSSLKLLCERCSNGATPAYNLPKPRKIRDPEPYQHFYTIPKTLDRKLKS